METMLKCERELTARRRDNKKRVDLIKKSTVQTEVKYIFNTFYRNQVSALYRQIAAIR